MSVEALIGSFGRLSSAAERVVSKLGAVSQAASDAGSGLDDMAKSAKTVLDEMLGLAENSDIAMWAKPMVEQLMAGKVTIAEFAQWLANVRGEMTALAAQGARPVLGDFEQEIQRLLTLLGELQGANRNEKKGR